MNETLIRRPGRPRKRSARIRNYREVNLQMEPALVVALDRHLEIEGKDSRSDLVRRACWEYLRRAAKRAARESGADDE